MWNNFTLTIAKAIRSSGQALDAIGRTLEVNPVIEHLQPCTKIVSFNGTTPTIKGSFIAPTASVIGKVDIGSNSTVWYGAIIRGDVNNITIGDGVSVGERSIIHCSGIHAKIPTNIGNFVSIGVGSTIHACTLEDECIVGDGSIVLDGAKIEKNAILAPGSLVSPNKTIPSGEYWSGVPAVFQRKLYPDELTSFITKAQEQMDLSTLHASEVSKTFVEIEDEEFEYDQKTGRNDYYYPENTKEIVIPVDGDLQGHMSPGRILNSPISARDAPDCRH